MFGNAKQKASRAGVKSPKLYSIAGMLRNRSFAGGFSWSGSNYDFSYQPNKAQTAGRRLMLTGTLEIKSAKGNIRHRLENVSATLISAQGGIGNAPPRKRQPPSVYEEKAGMPVVESTGSLSFAGVLYFQLSPLDARKLGLAADLSKVQLNARLAPRNDVERGLQAAYSSAVDAIHGKYDGDAASVAAGELNELLTGR